MTTQPRIALDDLTSDALDALYDERDRYRVAWQSARQRAEAYGEGIMRLCDDRDTYEGWLEQEQAHSAGLRAALAKSEQGRRNLRGLLEHHRDQGSLGILRTTRTRLARALKACARYRADVARLTAGQCTDQRAMCEQHHAPPVAGCPYPRCRAARATGRAATA
ncbi:hypothetical protein ACH4K8_20715 [Streptomyces anulatus]